jgi:hypothetical protein
MSQLSVCLHHAAAPPVKAEAVTKHGQSTFPLPRTPPGSRDSRQPILATMEAQKPIAFSEHLQLSSVGVQPASISFQVRGRVIAHRLAIAHIHMPSLPDFDA